MRKTNENMATNRTFTMIKPDATGAGHTGKIIDRIIESGFAIKAMKWTQLSLPTRRLSMAFTASVRSSAN